MSNTISQLEIILSARLDLTSREKVADKAQLAILDLRIKSVLDRMGKKPKETIEALDLEHKALEHLHVTTTQSSGADDRNFMRSIEKIKQRKKAIEAFEQLAAELDDLRTQRKTVLQALREKESSISEIVDGLRRVRIASRIGCSTNDVVEEVVPVPETAIARVIGRGGAKLRQLESTYDVSIVVEKSDNSVRLIGTPETIARAKDAVMDVVNTLTEEFEAREEVIVCLMMNKAELLYAIQERYNVRLDVSRAKKVIKISGYENAVIAAKHEIESLQCSRATISIEQSMLPILIGKGGSTIRALEENGRVQLELLKEEGCINVLGYRPDVDSTVAAMSKLIEDNREVEQIIQAPRSAVSNCLIGIGGSIAKSLQKELGIFIRTDKTETANAGPHSMESVVLKGSNSRVRAAIDRITRLLAAHTADSDVIEIPDHCVPLVVGKKGARINSIREEHPSVKIDVSGNTIHLLSSDIGARSSVRSVLAQIVSENFQEVLDFPKAHAVALKGAKGSSCRQKISNLGVTMDIAVSDELITLRGTVDGVIDAREILLDFRANNYFAEWECQDDDCAALMNIVPGAKAQPFKEFESEFGVSVFVHRGERAENRKKQGPEKTKPQGKKAPTSAEPLEKKSLDDSSDKCFVRIRGNESAVPKALAAIQSYLKGESRRGTAIIPVDSHSISGLIGRGGNIIKKLEEDYHMKIDIFSARDKIRIRSLPNRLHEAVLAVQSFLMEIRSSTTVDIPSESLPSNNDAIVKAINDTQKRFGVEISLSTTAGESNHCCYTIRGPSNVIDAAKTYFKEQLSGRMHYIIPISKSQLEKLTETHFANIDRISAKHGAEVSVGKEEERICIDGPIDGVMKARVDVMKLVDHLFPSEFLSVAMPPKCLLDVGSYRHLVEVEDKTGAKLHVDHALSCIHVRGSVASVALAVSVVRENVVKWKDTHLDIELDEFLLPILIGRNGSTIESLEKETNTSIRLIRGENRLEVVGPDKGTVEEAERLIVDKIVSWKSQHWETNIDKEIMGPFIGKEGANIKKLKSDTTVSIDVESKSGTVKIHGPPDEVITVKRRILTFVEEERLNGHIQKISIPRVAFPVLIGSKGATIREIQQASGCKIDTAKDEEIVTLKGRPEFCAKALSLIEELLAKEGISLKSSISEPPAIEEPEEKEVESLEAVVHDSNRHKFPPGATPEMIARIRESTLSKSALRRARRKAQQYADLSSEHDDDYEESEHAGFCLSQEKDLTESNESKTKPVVSRLAQSPKSLVKNAATCSQLASELLLSVGLAGKQSVPPGFSLRGFEKTPTPSMAAPLPGVAENLESNGESNKVTTTVATSEYYKSKSGFKVRL